MTILLVYLLLTTLLACRYGWIMWRQLDEFDWHYRSTDIWVSFCVGLIFWPVFLVTKPALVLKGTTLFDASGDPLDIRGGIASRMRTLNQIIRNPPTCGSKLVYQHYHCLVDGQETIPLTFDVTDIKTHLENCDLPFFWDQEAQALIAMLNHSDERHSEPTEIPDVIDFSNLALQLIDKGFGEVKCPLCQTTYKTPELPRAQPPIQAGWNYDTFECPQGHSLFSFRTIHAYMKRQRDIPVG